MIFSFYYISFRALIHCYFRIVNLLGYPENTGNRAPRTYIIVDFAILQPWNEIFHCFFSHILAYEPLFVPQIIIILHKIMRKGYQTTCSNLENRLEPIWNLNKGHMANNLRFLDFDSQKFWPKLVPE